MSDPLEDSRDYWDRHAQRDPLWAILSDTTKRDGKWDIARFFQTGVREIEALLYELDAQEFVRGGGAALDFGCGVGRLTQALAPHFARVVGVDVSSRMVDLATRLNQRPQTVSYVCNHSPDLRTFEDRSFDFIVSSIVLQHVRPEIACSYIREFLRVLTPAGIAVFQLPSHHRRVENRPLESAVKPMADEAYRASLRVAGVPGAVRPGGQVTLQVEVTNASMFDWIQRDYGAFSVGDHWLDGESGRMLTRDDGRTRLPATLRAGAACRLSLVINAPANPGEYQCELDVAHEGVLWFNDRGSDVVRLSIRVGEDDATAGSGAEYGSRGDAPRRSVAARDGRPVLAPGATPVESDDDPGEFPMYGVPLNSVAGLIADEGATLLHIENDRSCGEDWVSYRYFVQAAQSR